MLLNSVLYCQFSVKYFKPVSFFSHFQGDQVTVLFIDHGDEEQLSVSLIHNLHKNFCNLPAQVILRTKEKLGQMALKLTKYFQMFSVYGLLDKQFFDLCIAECILCTSRLGVWRKRPVCPKSLTNLSPWSDSGWAGGLSPRQHLSYLVQYSYRGRHQH